MKHHVSLISAIALVLAASVPSAFAAEDKVEKDPLKAIEEYSKAVQQSPDNADNWYNLALAYIKLERWQEALEPALKAVELKPDGAGARAHFRAGEALAGVGRHDDAVKQFEEAVKVDPTLTAAHARLGQAYVAAKRYQDAIDSLKAALKNKPENPMPFYSNIGEAYLKLGDKEQATRWFEKGAEVAPNDPVTHFNIGVMYRGLADSDAAFYVKAAESFGKASDLAPKDAKNAYLAAETFYFAEKKDLAKPYLERYLKLDPDGSKAGADMHAMAVEMKADIAK